VKVGTCIVEFVGGITRSAEEDEATMDEVPGFDEAPFVGALGAYDPSGRFCLSVYQRKQKRMIRYFK